MSQGLKQNALSILDTITLAVAGTAPSYSLNATTAALIASVGLASPAALLYGAIPMFGISFAFKYLNEWRADAGATYAWVGRSLNPYLGFLAAWTFLLLSTAFMVAAALPVGVITLGIIAPQSGDSVLAATLVGGVWFIGVATLTILGVHVAAGFQRVMTSIEAIALLVLAVGAFVKFSAAPQNPFSLAWFSPTSFGSFDVFMTGMLIAVFYYFGWDVSSNVAEETQGEGSSGGLSGVLGMVGIVMLFLLIQVSVQMGMTTAMVEENSANLLGSLGDMILPHPWGDIAILAVLLSTVGTIETQLTQCARLLFSMGRDRVIHERFAEIHPRFQTPWLAGLVITVLALFLMILSSSSESVGAVMGSLISAIGVMVSFYYGLTGIACAWYYRKTLSRNWQTLLMRGVWPAISAIFLLYLGVAQIPSLGLEVALWTTGAIALGVLVMVYFKLKYGSLFYQEPIECHEEPAKELDLV
ncbi:MAG: APC family permease [Oculatellaceae cyanobacterium bins.114]|nr:APC family permease [Oculatellaceae cyanobacterium bins.114]